MRGSHSGSKKAGGFNAILQDAMGKVGEFNTTASKSGMHRWRSNPGRNYPSNTANFMISPAFSLSGATKATKASR